MVCAICLLPPTLMMGATLPAIARWVETTPTGVSWLGFFYGGNIVGAVFGCLLAGFYLLRLNDMNTATYVAAIIKRAVAAARLGLAACTTHTPAAARVQGQAAIAPGSAAVYVTIALSGMSALGAEVVWTRLLSLMLGATVYTFSIILAVFLIGLGIGSSIGAMMARSVTRPRVALGVCQMLLMIAIAWAAGMTAASLPYWPVKSEISQSPWYLFQVDLVRCLWAVLPASILWGASFRRWQLAAVATKGTGPRAARRRRLRGQHRRGHRWRADLQHGRGRHVGHGAGVARHAKRRALSHLPGLRGRAIDICDAPVASANRWRIGRIGSSGRGRGGGRRDCGPRDVPGLGRATGTT